MARSFWNKRKDSMNKAGSYIKATESVSRPTAFVMTILGILVIGGLFFGVFWGARWSFYGLSRMANSWRYGVIAILQIVVLSLGAVFYGKLGSLSA